MRLSKLESELAIHVRKVPKPSKIPRAVSPEHHETIKKRKTYKRILLAKRLLHLGGHAILQSFLHPTFHDVWNHIRDHSYHGNTLYHLGKHLARKIGLRPKWRKTRPANYFSSQVSKRPNSPPPSANPKLKALPPTAPKVKPANNNRPKLLPKPHTFDFDL